MLVMPQHRAFAADKIKLGMISVNAYSWPVWVAKEKGYFKDENLEVAQLVVRSVSKAIQALSANSTDLLYPGSADAGIRAQLKKAPVTIIGGGFSKALYDLVAGEKYKKVEDLRGGTMGVINLTSGSTLFLQKILAKHGLTYPKDYGMLVVGGSSSRFAAVKIGGVAAAMVPPPLSFQAVDSGLNIVASLGNYLADYQFIVINANRDWLKTNRGKAVRFLKAIIRAHKFINDPANKKEATEILQNRHKIKPKYAAMVYKMIVEDLKPIPNDASVSIKAMEGVIKLLLERKKLDKSYPASEFFDDSVRKEAMKKLGL